MQFKRNKRRLGKKKGEVRGGVSRQWGGRGMAQGEEDKEGGGTKKDEFGKVPPKKRKRVRTRIRRKVVEVTAKREGQPENLYQRRSG